MEQFVEVYDNVFPKNIEDKIENTILFKTSYHFNVNAVSTQDVNYIPAFFHSFFDEQLNPTLDSSFYVFNILYKFCSLSKIHLDKIIKVRSHIQVPTLTPSLVHPPHIDGSYPHWVVLYYVNNSDGDTILYKNDKKTELKRITPKKGRIVFFDGSIWHSGSTPQTTHRSVINFNFIGKKL